MATKLKKQNQAKIGVSFAQSNEGSIPEWKKKIKCHNCRKFGHFKNKYPELKKDYANFNYTNSVFNGIENQDNKEDYLDAMQYWILLDNQSTTDIFVMKIFLRTPMRLKTLHRLSTTKER